MTEIDLWFVVIGKTLSIMGMVVLGLLASAGLWDLFIGKK